MANSKKIKWWQKSPIILFSPDRSENPCKLGFSLQDCNGEREQCFL